MLHCFNPSCHLFVVMHHRIDPERDVSNCQEPVILGLIPLDWFIREPRGEQRDQV